MKRIDFHIHTVPTIWDAAFCFDLVTLERYVADSGLDAIAITNHNVFDRQQFTEIQAALSIPVFPGVEVTLDQGHTLVVAEPSNIDVFEGHAQALGSRMVNVDDTISVEDFIQLFGGLADYLVIPHYGKSPTVPHEALEHLGNLVFCGEVTSPKKFMSTKKDDRALTPVIFSDCRISESLDPLPIRHTFVDCGDLSLAALKTCLRDRSKVDLSATRGLFQILGNGQMISTGLNVVLGGRSSGKSHFLSLIDDAYENVKYIKQFSLVERDESQSSREFTEGLGRMEGQAAEKFLASFKEVVDDVIDVDLIANDRKIEAYVDSLHDSARAAHQQDVFSKAALFNASEYPSSNNDDLKKLIEAVRLLIRNVKYREVLDRHLDAVVLIRLAIDLIDRYRDEEMGREKRDFVNKLVREIQRELRTVTGAPGIDDFDLYGIMLDREKVARFNDLVEHVRSPAAIKEEEFQKYRVVVSKGVFAGAGEVKKRSGTAASFRTAFGEYDDPYQYLQALLQVDEVSRGDIYKLFVKISYQILNQHRLNVSGGERSEFNLLQQIKDAQKYDLLLIDEPESSFDNLFLRSDVNQLLRVISNTMPVVVVTHNSTVGASIEPNYLLYTEKTIDGGRPRFRIFSGYPTDQALSTVDGETISTLQLTLDSLEAGTEAYRQRKAAYEALEG